MSIPSPPFDLVNHCSAIVSNTLYVYSPAGFARLALEKDAQWETLTSGQAVTGGACVVAGNDAMYIVGGSTGATGALTSYSGLQRYTFASQAWETLPLAAANLQQRTKHGAAYIPSMNSIVTYGGSTDPTASGIGQETFGISLNPPYDVQSFNAQGAPALISPMMMEWSNDLAVLIGGAADNVQVWLFGQSLGWQNLGTTLPAGLGLDSGAKKCTIVTGDDGSKVLELFDMSVSPNVVSQYALVINGAPAASGTRVGNGQASSKQRRALSRRQLSIANWPTYNSTLAPSTTRDGFSLASDGNGTVVISGGNSQEPIALFSQSKNAWENATAVFKPDTQVVLSVSTTSSSAAPTSSATTTSTASSTSSAPTSSQTSENVLGTGQSKSKVLTTLGATLGAVLGLAAILIILLLLLRRKKLQRRNAMGGGVNEKDQDRLSFADQGADFMKEAGGAQSVHRAPYAMRNEKSNHSSLNSLQIFQPKTSNGHKRGMPSDSSQVPLTKNKSPLGVSDPMEMSQISNRSSPTFTMKSMEDSRPSISQPRTAAATLAPGAAYGAKDAKDGRTRSNGWSRYFANNDVTGLAAIQGGQRDTYNTEVSGISDVSKTSNYSNDRSMVGAQTVAPLELNLGPKFEGQRLSAVNTGSPTMGQSREDVHAGLQAELHRAGSTSSRASMDGDYDLASTNRPTPGTQSTWTPASRPSNDRPSTDTSKADARSIRSNYSGSNPFFSSSGEYDHRPRKGSSGTGVLPPPQIPKFNLQNYGDASRDSNASQMTVFPSGVESPKGNAFDNRQLGGSSSRGMGEYDFMPPKNVFGGNGGYRGSGASDVTVFPGAPAPTPSSDFGSPARNTEQSRNGPSGRKMSSPQDMGWLNLKPS